MVGEALQFLAGSTTPVWGTRNAQIAPGKWRLRERQPLSFGSATSGLSVCCNLITMEVFAHFSGRNYGFLQRREWQNPAGLEVGKT
jgi:hypothetical protein